jgi:tRNA G37 N-methylase TrmD
MKFNVLTLMPDMVRGALDYGVVGSAFEKGLCFLETVNPKAVHHRHPPKCG